LGETYKGQASYELGVDYMRAGLFDRAEEVFQTLSQTEAHGKASLQQLLQIYQQEKDWQSAIVCTRKLLRFTKAPRGENVAQFLCELAEEALSLHRLENAKEYLAQSLREDPGCVRASLIKARLELADGEYGAALQALKRVEFQNPAYLSEILQFIGICYEKLGKDRELMDYLEHLYLKFGVMEAATALAERIHRAEGASVALDYLLAAFEAKPCFQGLPHVIELLAAEEKKTLQSSNLGRITRIVNRLASETPRYRCAECGFSGSELHWRCPSCQYWNSITPA
jgi:lipopolysaccharide biosynthesis regulator YciM